MKKSKAIVILIVILGALAGLAYYASIILSSTGIGEEMSIPLGLDLSGGVSITYQVVDDNPSAEDMSDTIYKLQKRVEGYSTEASVYQVGDDRITVEIPGVSDANAILEDLGNPGSLEFQLPDGTVYMTGDQVADAQAGTTTDSYGNKQYVVQLKLTDDGAKLFADATTDNVGNYLPIVYDGETISYPQVKEAITGGTAQISGMKTYEDAETLATKAAAIGLVIVMIFMIVMYQIPGLAAAIALAIYTCLVIATLYLFEITLTLPGIAGIILSIGMAVDANVIIFARIREEIATGKTVNSSMKIGFKKAMSAILDGNITTIIAALVLIALGSGTVKGFAYTLMIGIVLSMFTALVVTRWILYSFYAIGIRDEKFYGRAKERRTLNFLGKRGVFFAVSLAMIAAGFIGMGVHAAKGSGALNYGLDFVGGTSTTADYGKDYTIEEIENTIVPVVADVIGDNDIMANKVEGTTQITVKTRTLTLDERDTLEQALVDQLGADESSITSQSISSTVSNEMRSDAIVAVIVASICMLIYIWFRFKDIRFGASAIIALLHDVLVVLAVYSLLRISVGNTFIACMLTIIGYSVNDTIVIFDRIRENLGRTAAKQTPELLAEVANKSLTQTLSRSINTSLTTFIMVFMLFLLGVASIREFALPLMAGLLCGAYSSICIATELWYIMRLHLGKNRLIKK